MKETYLSSNIFSVSCGSLRNHIASSGSNKRHIQPLCSDKDHFLFILFKTVAKYHWMPYTVFITMSTSTIPRNSRSLTFIIRLAVAMTSTKSNSLYVQINEIVTTGKLSKLEHFENDEKVMYKVHDLDMFSYLCQYRHNSL